MKFLNQLKNFLKNNKVFLILLKEFVKHNKMFLVMLLVTPGFVWTIAQPSKLLSEWLNFPIYSKQKIDTFFSEDRVGFVEDLRWENKKYTKSDILSRFYYNKLTVIGDDFFNYLTFLSPRLFFQSGEGSGFSPPGVGPVAALYFVFFVLGVVFLLRNQRYKLFSIILLFSFIAYLSGKKNLAFLLPVLILYVYTTYVGMKNSTSRKSVFYGSYIIFCLYLLGRSIWLVQL